VTADLRLREAGEPVFPKDTFQDGQMVAEEQKQFWTKSAQDLLRKIPYDRVINIDETSWKFFPDGIVAWVHARADGVCIDIQGGEKTCLTVLANLPALGQKLPVFS
jgi:hypothetical protein